MGSSAKKKREKRKDFQKTKLKVGKTIPKASNVTNTTFTSKSIVLNQQSLKTSAPSEDAQFAHHLSLLGSHSDSQCRDSLAYLTAASTRMPKVPRPWALIIPKLLPLITRTSTSLRTQLIKLFRVIPPQDVQSHVEMFTIYLRAGMTSLSFDIRADGFEILSWLLDTAGSEVVSCPGGWVKLLKCFVAVFAWDKATNNAFQPNRTATANHPGNGDRSLTRQLQVFGQFLHCGISVPPASRDSSSSSTFPLWDPSRHVLPKRPNCFAYLNLFGPVHDAESDLCEDRAARQKALQQYQHLLGQGLSAAQKQGGELGRMAGVVRKIWQDGMKDS